MIEIIAGVIVLILAIIAVAQLAKRRSSGPSRPTRSVQESMGAVYTAHLYNERFEESLDRRMADADSPLLDAYRLIKEFAPGKKEIMAKEDLDNLFKLANYAKVEATRAYKINHIMGEVYGYLRLFNDKKISEEKATSIVGYKLNELKSALSAVKVARKPEMA